MYFVYIIKSRKNDRFYIGSAQDVKERLRQHERGKTRSLKNKGPFDIIRIEEFETRTEAFSRERQIKRYKGGQAFKKLIA
ncbi:MAG TPA: endonuclease [Candidatus Omnitrophica bacterium]|nr:endonuclease [Candidatus Omnitrophota bacterium]